MVLYNKYKFRQQSKQKKRKSLDNPVVNEASELNFHKPNIDYLLNFKKGNGCQRGTGSKSSNEEKTFRGANERQLHNGN